MSRKILFICGPTATGKTRLASELARKFSGELISADSRQVYREMDIGTGKDISEAKGIPIWLVDVVNPNEDFSVRHFVRLAQDAIDNITRRGLLPVVVGGTGLYIQALIHPPETIDIPPDIQLRHSLQNASVLHLQKYLTTVDKSILDRMNSSDQKNPRRLIRKIEILSSFKKSALPQHDMDADVLMIGLTAPKEELDRRIDARVDTRLKQGLLEEIHDLIRDGYTWDLPSMSGLGYGQWQKYFLSPEKNSQLYDGCLSAWKHEEHKYARRQLTWFRKMSQIQWFDITHTTITVDVTKKVSAWYTQVKRP